MKRVARTTDSRVEDLDALLADFFRAEMPAPWPAFRAPARRTRPTLAVRPTWTSRLALVAAVTLLLLGAWMLPRPAAPVSAGRSPALPSLDAPRAEPPHGLEKGGAPAKPQKRNGEKGKDAPAPRR
jgi:hypothetical protein